MTITNIFFTFLSLIFLLLCLLAPMGKSKKADSVPAFRAILSPHTLYAVLLLFTSLIHGILSGNRPGMLSGKLTWFCLLALCLTSFFRHKMDRQVFLKLHRKLAVLVGLFLILHIFSGI